MTSRPHQTSQACASAFVPRDQSWSGGRLGSQGSHLNQEQCRESKRNIIPFDRLVIEISGLKTAASFIRYAWNWNDVMGEGLNMSETESVISHSFVCRLEKPLSVMQKASKSGRIKDVG